MQNDPDHPWVFQRDEIDLLEEDIDEIFQRYRKKEQFQVENLIIQEQMETEELSDVEFTLRMNEGFFEKKKDEAPRFVLDKQFEIKARATEEIKRNPLYESALIWSNAVFRFASSLYEKKIDQLHDAFRVYFNVKFVPLKLSIFHADDYGDELSLDIAEKELELALVYVTRVLESLSNLVFFDREQVFVFLTKGESLRQNIHKSLLAIKKRKQSRKNGFV
jgi:hypothetical protein